SVRHIFKPISYLEIQLLSGVSGGYIKNFIKLSRRVSRGISIVGRKEPVLAVQLLQEMIAEEPGARERAIEFLRLFGDQP
ncbi:hypothetical protein G3W07_01400, partial [Klebsiella pneumoniae]|nr:hypothetical protein [Klebsiella pneumoniae]